MEYREFTAKTVDDAITDACQSLSVTSDKLEYEIMLNLRKKEASFNEISKNILSTFERFCALKISSFDDVLEIDKKIRQELK